MTRIKTISQNCDIKQSSTVLQAELMTPKS